MQTYLIDRSGSPPLEFEGEEITTADTPPKPPKTHGWHRHWHELKLYKTKGGQFVLAVNYRTDFEDSGNDTAFICKDAREVEYVLTRYLDEDADQDIEDFYDPLEHVIPFPEGHHDQQARMNDLVDRDYSKRVTRILRELGVTEKIN